MKHIINFTFIMLVLINLAPAQLTPWYLTGNSIASGDFLGTTNSQDLVFKTNNSEKMRVQTNGNVGIAIASPSSVLHIDGNGTPSTTGEVFRTDAPMEVVPLPIGAC